MEGLYFNVNNGYIEGVIRGYRNSLLSSANYSNLTQCEAPRHQLELPLQLSEA
jgi:V-type H+-transporting ATPase subunit d